MTYAATPSGSDGRLEDNETLGSVQDSREKFCAEYHSHNFGYGDEECKEIKSFAEATDDE